ncbi:MAG: nitrate reductase subunit beta [Nitrospiraceae bacterium]|nr:nitrate reductase subunit beta [Nitrospiraceae bacterium]
MKIRAQVSMVFHLDKCIGCHTCSIACKNLWTSRRGTEYMWWNNVETKPGTGYPTLWEDQGKYKGGWKHGKEKPGLLLQGRAAAFMNIFFNPFLPSIDDYYEPWTYSYRDLFDSPHGEDQPVAMPVSEITGKNMEIEAGPNWDDDLGGSYIYAAGDPNMKAVTEEERRQMFELERMIFFYLPRICNHCLNPGCLAACPAGAIYKRAEDGIVLVGQDKCRAWRMCVSGCPYKKVYYNWETGKSEKCILCYPRQETGQPPACFHSCVGRIRYLGMLLYDADRIEQTAALPGSGLVKGFREIVLDPFDPGVIKKAGEDGVPEQAIKAAQASPVYKYLVKWKLALPLHPEFRTIPMLFYVPSLLPVTASVRNGLYEPADEFFGALENTRVPAAYLASLFTAGDSSEIVAVNKKLYAVRLFKRAQSVGDVDRKKLDRLLEEAQTTPEEIEEIYQMTSLAAYRERFAVPPFMREQAIEAMEDPAARKGDAGAGFISKMKRGW